MIQVAKKASVLKRRKSRNRMEVDQQGQQQGQQQDPASGGGGGGDNSGTDTSRLDNDGDIIFYMEEPKACTPNRVRRENR